MADIYDRAATIIRQIYDRRITTPPVLDMESNFPDGQKFALAWRAIREEALAVSRRLRVLHVTSTLGPGGAERQLANSVIRLAHMRNVGIEAELAVEDLNPVHGRDFFLAPIRATGIPVYCLDDERQEALIGRRSDRVCQYLCCLR